MEIRRPLKRNLPRLGPPDIYPQDPRQKEDELTSVNVKQGYINSSIVPEFGSAKNANLDASGVYFSALSSEKHRINTIKDTQRKKQLVNTKEIWYVHAKTKNAVDNWFRDLANGTKSLGQLGKRIPIFNSKEGMFTQLFESRVPIAKAVWFIKMSAVHTVALSESNSKSKKRQLPDQYQELTVALIKYLREILYRIFEQSQHQQQQQQQQQPQPHPSNDQNHTTNEFNQLLMQQSFSKPLSASSLFHQSTHLGHQNLNTTQPTNTSISILLNQQTNFTSNLNTSLATLIASNTASTSSFSTISPSTSNALNMTNDDFILAFNQWQYQNQLARYLFDEGLLDKYEFLCFILELIEKRRSMSDLVVKLICPLMLEYTIDYSKSAVLSRRLANACAKKLSQLFQHQSSSTNPSSKEAIYIFSSILQVICIECPTSMVRHHISDTKNPHSIQGSPFDVLPCLPSSLPMVDSDINSELRRSIHEAEREILHRSSMADSKWSCYSSKKAETSKSLTVNRLLTVLDVLDRHNFDKIDPTNSFDALYSKIFPPIESSLNESKSTNQAHETLSNHSGSAQSGATTDSTSSSANQTDLKNIYENINESQYESHVINLLCEWATTTQRTGEHRVLITARLLERRQSELQSFNVNLIQHETKKGIQDPKSEMKTNSPNHSSDTSNERQNPNVSKEDATEDVVSFIFQDLLVQFLDENAPVIDDSQTDDPELSRAFNNLVLLFSELIRCGVFSHYNYMCTLISRGMFNDLAVNTIKTQDVQLDNHIDDVDADLGKILQDIKEGQQDEAADILFPDFLGSSRDDIGNRGPQINKLSPFSGLGDRPSTLDRSTGDLDDKAKSVSQSSSASNIISTSSFSAHPSVESKSIGLTASTNSDRNEKFQPKNPNERKHLIYVKHFPVPDDENFARDINQRNILLYGFGKEREDAKHVIKKLNKEISKLLSRRSSRDINDGGKIKKLAGRESCNPESILQKFESLNHHDKHVITNGLSTIMLEIFTGVSNGQTSSLPTLESVSFFFDLFTLSLNVSGLLDLIVPVLEELPDVEAQIRLKCPLLTNHYTHSIALCIVGMLYKYHSCTLLLSKDELCSIFESLYKLVNHVQNPGICMTSAERVILCYLHDLYCSQSGKLFSQSSSFIQKIKQQIQNATAGYAYNSIEHEWTPTFLTNIVNQLNASQHLYSSSSTNPILNASYGATSFSNFSPMTTNDLTSSIRQQLYALDSPTIRQLNEVPASRYRFVCDAIYLSSTSTNPDLVNDIAVLCADLTSKCPALMNDWIQALQALFCSAQRELSYRQLTNKINISEPQILDNIAIFTAILVARRCIQFDEFIIRCAIGAILAPLSSTDKAAAEPGVRLTCHLLLILFRNREAPTTHTRQMNHLTMYNNNNSNTFNQAFPNYGSNTPNYSGGFLGSGVNSFLQSMNKESDSQPRTRLCLKYLCDYHLLRSACCNIKTECHITLLKAIRLLAMLASPSDELDMHGRARDIHLDDIGMDSSGQLAKNSIDAFADSPSVVSGEVGSRNTINLQAANLHQFADAILRLLCSQRWLHDKCLSDSEIFTTTDPEKNILLDPRIDVKQSQRLLYMICYSKSPELQADVGLDDQGSDQVASIVKMFENLDVWSMRLALLRLQFMYAYCKSQSNVLLNDWFDNLAKAVVEFFQKFSQGSENQEKEVDSPNSDPKKSKKQTQKQASIGGSTNSAVTSINKVWLIEPLLDKLSKPSNGIQSKIIKASASLMESASVRPNSLPSLNQTYLSTAAASTKFKERTLSQRGSGSTNPSNLASTSLLGFQPFLSLLLTCLKNQDKERETLLTSLNSQLYQAIHEKVEDIAYKQSLQDGLELRLCLIGQMFDTIQKSSNLTSDWATLLFLLIINNLVDPQIDYGLYVAVVDMLAMLIHSAYASDPTEQREDSKKQYQNLMKKFRKELVALEEKGFLQMKLVNPLLPLIRQMTEVITCEPMGSLVDTKGEKVENFYSIDKKKGLKVSGLQEVSPWDLIEGHKNPSPLCWSWFGAVKLEHKPLKSDENNRLMSWHTHTTRHSTAYYFKAPHTEDDGASCAKRSNAEKKPSQSNPLLKSLIEANDENSSTIRRDLNGRSIVRTEDQGDKLSDVGPIDINIHYASETNDGRSFEGDSLMEDYCELPPDSLFDSTPIETIIEDIKTAMQAEHDVLSNRNKVLANQTKPAIPTPVKATVAINSPLTPAANTSMMMPTTPAAPMTPTPAEPVAVPTIMPQTLPVAPSPTLVHNSVVPEPRMMSGIKTPTLPPVTPIIIESPPVNQKAARAPAKPAPQRRRRQKQTQNQPILQPNIPQQQQQIQLSQPPNVHQPYQIQQNASHPPPHHPIQYQLSINQVNHPSHGSYHPMPAQSQPMHQRPHMQPQQMPMNVHPSHQQQGQQIQPQQIPHSQNQHPMSFQTIHQHPHHQQQQQQQMFAPQQVAGHSRPALTAMLHQKHLAAGNVDNKMHPPHPRFNFG